MARTDREGSAHLFGRGLACLPLVQKPTLLAGVVVDLHSLGRLKQETTAFVLLLLPLDERPTAPKIPPAPRAFEFLVAFSFSTYLQHGEINLASGWHHTNFKDGPAAALPPRKTQCRMQLSCLTPTVQRLCSFPACLHLKQTACYECYHPSHPSLSAQRIVLPEPPPREDVTLGPVVSRQGWKLTKHPRKHHSRQARTIDYPSRTIVILIPRLKQWFSPWVRHVTSGVGGCLSSYTQYLS